jgi:hypothetical protein
LVVVSILPLPCAAQMLYGSLVGNVTDESQGLLRGAEVVITNANTNLIRKAATNELGLYSFPNVPSTYTVKVAVPGFSDVVRTDVRSRQTPPFA